MGFGWSRLLISWFAAAEISYFPNEVEFSWDSVRWYNVSHQVMDRKISRRRVHRCTLCNMCLGRSFWYSVTNLINLSIAFSSSSVDLQKPWNDTLFHLVRRRSWFINRRESSCESHQAFCRGSAIWVSAHRNRYKQVRLAMNKLLKDINSVQIQGSSLE